MTRRILGCLLAVLAIGPSCGRASTTSADPAAEAAAQAAQRSLDDRTAGRIEFALTAAAEESEPVGFEIEGEYSFEEDHELAVLDLTYRQILGEESTETTIVSTGEEAWVVADGEATELRGDQLGPLRVGEGSRSAAVPELDLAGWLRDGEIEREGDRTTIAGEVRASALIADLRQIAGQVAGASGGELDEEAATRIDNSAESSEMRIETEDGSLRALRASVDFGAEVPAALREALGSYAGARLELSMTVEDTETPLRVRPPSRASGQN